MAVNQIDSAKKQTYTNFADKVKATRRHHGHNVLLVIRPTFALFASGDPRSTVYEGKLLLSGCQFCYL